LHPATSERTDRRNGPWRIRSTGSLVDLAVTRMNALQATQLAISLIGTAILFLDLTVMFRIEKTYFRFRQKLWQF
jgi:hypothetical protein